MPQLTLKETLNLVGISDLTLTQPQQKFIIESTQNLIKRNGKDWILKNQTRLKAELEIVFNEI